MFLTSNARVCLKLLADNVGMFMLVKCVFYLIELRLPVFTLVVIVPCIVCHLFD
jgi:hypothetical protein